MPQYPASVVEPFSHSGPIARNVADAALMLTAMRGFVTWGEYAATKAGIISLTQTAAMEYGPAGLRVNCVAPGIIETPMAMAEAPDMVKRNARIFAPLGRIGQPEEAAAAEEAEAAREEQELQEMTSLRFQFVGVFRIVQMAPFGEVYIEPVSPTATKVSFV